MPKILRGISFMRGYGISGQLNFYLPYLMKCNCYQIKLKYSQGNKISSSSDNSSGMQIELTKLSSVLNRSLRFNPDILVPRIILHISRTSMWSAGSHSESKQYRCKKYFFHIFGFLIYKV